ncbi:hypothetical protein [Streptomyces cavourensis]|nr:hypothetical protein [Streptomyces cavourensis]
MSDQVRDQERQPVLRVKGRVLVGPDEVRDRCAIRSGSRCCA